MREKGTVKIKIQLFLAGFSFVMVLTGLFAALWLVDQRSGRAAPYMREQTFFAYESGRDGEKILTVFGREYMIP